MTGSRTEYDLVVLGGGSGGYACALRAAEQGLSVVLVEKEKLGGVCLHRGCIPTKALLHAGEVADLTRRSARFGIRAEFLGVDMAAVRAYQDGVVATIHRGLRGLVRSRGITVVEGFGRLVSPTTVEVTVPGSTTESETPTDSDAPGAASAGVGVPGSTVGRYTGRHVVLATGSVPRGLPGLPADGQRILTSDHALRRERVPATAVILGGGAIGVEFASAWRSLGAEVTVVEALDRLVPTEDESSSTRLERAFRRRGITVRTGARLTAATPTDDGVRVELADGAPLQAELLLVAVGREPVSAGLGYEEVGVALDGGHVLVDELCRTNLPTVSAVGDLIRTPQLAHAGFAEGILVADRLAGREVSPIDYAGVPRITYSDPEVASVGLTTAQARDRGVPVERVEYDLAGNGRARILGAAGAVTVIRAVDGPVLGVHMVGSGLGELAAEAQLIYNWEALPDEVAALIHPHPTLSEALGEAHLALAGRPLHVHG